MSVIEVRELQKKYKEFEAVRRISFNVEQGEIFGILGPNGAGKTTTLEIIECLTRQTSGECRVLNFDNIDQPQEIKNRIGVQLQNSEYPQMLTLRELLTLFASLYGNSIDPLDILIKVGLGEKADVQVSELSGGQKQRFTIASALVHKPLILFLDEPTTGLDPQARRNMWSLIRQLNEEGMTIVMTTHYMEEAEYLCSRVAIMDQGRILRIENPRKLIQEVSKVYKLSFFVNVPITAELFKGIAIDRLYNEHPKIVIEISDISMVAKIADRLKEKGITFSYFNLTTATLEDVYLQLTGHEYEQE